MQQRPTLWRAITPPRHALAMPLSRRKFFGLAGVCTGLAAFQVLPGVSWRGNAEGPAFMTYPFTLGVASGDPGWESVVLWTRLAPDPLHDGGMPSRFVDVQWEVAYDERMSQVVQQGTVTASPRAAHTVHVTVQGLEPERWYWYRFWADGVESPRGRTRTLPLPTVQPQRLRFALACCQDYQNGYYSAYYHMAQDDLDFVLHIGDYIYEDGPRTGGPRQVPDAEATTLEGYRNRYALYRLDPSLHAVHAAFPFLVTWDDHEVTNNYAGGYPSQGQNPAGLLARRTAAYQAYYEHMPLRRQAAPRVGGMQLFRDFHFGRLVHMYMLDTRQWRTVQPCTDGLQPLCPAAASPLATMLGTAQETWLLDGLQGSRTTWNVLAQQVVMMQWALRWVLILPDSTWTPGMGIVPPVSICSISWPLPDLPIPLS